MADHEGLHQVQLGLIGIGDWGEHVAQSIEAEAGVALCGCYARSADTRVAFAARHKCNAYSSLDEMLANQDIEGVIVMTPNMAHLEPVEKAAAAGKHCLVTKPIAATLEDGRAMIEVCQRAGVILTVGHQSRREPALRKLKTLLDAGDLGEPVMAEANISTGRGLGIGADQWRWKQEECPGGVLTQLGVHHIDTLQHLLGPVARVQSFLRRAKVAAQIEDATATLMEFESGVVGYLGSSYSSGQACWIKLYATRHVAHYDQHLGLTVSDDTWEGGAVREQAAPGMSLVWPIDTMREEVAEFAECIRTGKTPDISAEEALRNLAVVLAAVEANATQRLVEVASILGNG